MPAQRHYRAAIVIGRRDSPKSPRSRSSIPSPSRSTGSMCAGCDSRAISTNVGCSSRGLALPRCRCVDRSTRSRAVHRGRDRPVERSPLPGWLDGLQSRPLASGTRTPGPVPARFLAERWPAPRPLGSVRFVIPSDRLPVRGSFTHTPRRPGGPLQFGLVVLDQEHPGNLVAPPVSRQCVGGRPFVARCAMSMRSGRSAWPDCSRAPSAGLHQKLQLAEEGERLGRSASATLRRRTLSAA